MKIIEGQKALYQMVELATQCPLCDSSAADFLLAAWDRLHRLPGDFAFVRCARCQLVRLSPRPVPSQIAAYYPDEYHSYQTSAQPLLSRAAASSLRDQIRDSVLSAKGYGTPRLKAWQRVLRPIFKGLFGHRIPYGYGPVFPPYRQGGRALDIGCGSATFLNALKHHGWQVTGVDFNRNAAEAAKRAFDIDVFIGEIEAAPFAPASFDYIHMSHIIEHVYDPLKTMRVVARLLKPDGTVYVETPNVASFNQRRCGSYWLLWDAPRHLFLFSPDSLKQTLKAAGLRAVRMRTVVQDVYGWEDVFRREEQQGSTLTDRPRLSDRPVLQPAARPRAALLRLFSRVNRLVRPLDSDILQCWATKD